MFYTIKRLLLKQHIVPWVGAVMLIIAGILLYFSMTNFLLISLMSYQTSIKPWTLVHAPWLSLGVFIFLLICGAVIAGIIEYKFVMPSRYSTSNVQSATHNSPLMQEIAKALKMLEDIEKRLERLEEKSGHV